MTFDGSIDISVVGGTPPYSYLWSGPNSYSSTNEDVTNLQSGIYNCIVTDANNCITPFSDTVAADQACSYGVGNTVPPVCYGDNNGQIVINQVFGTGPFTYSLYIDGPSSWSQVGGSITIADTFYTFNNLGEATYRYTVTAVSYTHLRAHET